MYDYGTTRMITVLHNKVPVMNLNGPSGNVLYLQTFSLSCFTQHLRGSVEIVASH